MIVNNYLSKYFSDIDHNLEKEFEYIYGDKLHILDVYKQRYKISIYLNKYKIIPNETNIFINIFWLILNKKIKYNYNLLFTPARDILDSNQNIITSIWNSLGMRISIAEYTFTEVMCYGIANDDFSDLSIFVKFICNNKNNMFIKYYYTFIRCIFDFLIFTHIMVCLLQKYAIKIKLITTKY